MTNAQAAPAHYLYIYIWLILFGVILFAFFVAADLGLIRSMLAIDSSYLSGVSIFVFFAASVHVLTHLVMSSKRLAAAEAQLCQPGDAPGTSPVNGFILCYLAEMRDARKARQPAGQGDTAREQQILEIYADRLRAPLEIGSFIVELLIRLGLLGTIIGFIIILGSLVKGPLPGADEIQKLLIVIGGGMGTALYTTLAGLIAASLLTVQYMVLSRSVEHLLGVMIRLGGKTP